jgi:hypothetical protein
MEDKQSNDPAATTPPKSGGFKQAIAALEKCRNEQVRTVKDLDARMMMFDAGTTVVLRGRGDGDVLSQGRVAT